MVLSELLVESEDDVEDIEWLTLVTHCHHSASQSSILDATRVRKFLSSLNMPNFPNDEVAFHMHPSSPTPSALKGGFDTPPPGRKGRKSGIFMAQDLIPGVSTTDPQTYDTFVDGTSRRHAGGQSERDQISSQYASDGGGTGGFGIGKNIHDPKLKSTAALKQQETVRLKMVTNASVKIPEWNGEAEDWFDFSPLFIRRMENAGYGCVCLPDFLETAKGFGWNQADIVEAKKFVWQQMDVAMQTHKKARNALLIAGPEYDGEICWQQLEINYTMDSHGMEETIKERLRLFKPTSREQPDEMIQRFTLLVDRYNKLEVKTEDWGPARKIRKAMELFSHWGDLVLTSDLLANLLILPSTRIVTRILPKDQFDPNLISYDSACRRFLAVWRSFGSGESAARVKARLTNARRSSHAGDDDDELLRRYDSRLDAIDKSISVLATSVKSSHESKSQAPSLPRNTEDAECLNIDCTKRFLVVRNRQVCRDCFEKVKTTRGTISLAGMSTSGKDYTGKTFSILDSDDPRDEKRGGWKIVIRSLVPVRALKLRCLNVALNIRAPTAGIPVYPKYPTVFFGADSCAGIGATGLAALFHDGVTPVDYVIEGINSESDALIPVEGSGVATFLAYDRSSGQTLILKYGGMLKCDPKFVSSTVGSSSQVGNWYNLTKGVQGARFHTADPENACVLLPGGCSVALHTNDDGAFGCDLQPVDKLDPRLQNAKTIWMSDDCVYRPPGKYHAVPLKINSVVCKLLRSAPLGDEDFETPLPVWVEDMHLPDVLIEDDPKALANKVVADNLSPPAMGTYSYVAPLSGSKLDLGILQARFGGFASKKIADTIETGFGGKSLLTTGGHQALRAFVTTFSHPASNMSAHKLRKQSKLDHTLKRKFIMAGSTLLQDTLYTDYPKPLFPYLQLFVDYAVPTGSCYAMWSKSGEEVLECLKAHVATHSKPPVLTKIRSDNAPELIYGPVRAWCESHCIQVLANTPRTPAQNPIEVKYVRVFSEVTTYLMLDSQLPQKFTEKVGKMACLIISFQRILYDGRDTTGYYEIHGMEADLRMLKRIGCEVFFLLPKEERGTFGSLGVRGVLISLSLLTHPSWTYEVWSPLTGRTYQRRDVLFLESSMPFRDARAMMVSADGQASWLRRGLGKFTRSMLRADDDDDSGLTSWLEENPGDLNDIGVAGWLPVHDSVASPIQVGDTLIVLNTPTEVVAVSPDMIQARDLRTRKLLSVPTCNPFFEDRTGMLTGARVSTRFRKQRALFTYNQLGGGKDKPIVEEKKGKKDGSDLVGSQFWDTSVGEIIPELYTVTGFEKRALDNGDPTSYNTVGYKLSKELEDPGAEHHFSRVQEVRKWMNSGPAVPATLPESSEPLDDGDFVQARQSSLFGSDGIGELMIADSAMAPEGDLASNFRTKISKLRVTQRPPKIPVAMVKKILKAGTKANVKFGQRLPKGYSDAINPNNPDSSDWKREMNKEIEALSDLGAFKKGLSHKDLPEGMAVDEIIDSIWVFDIKVDGRKRARFAARGDMEKNPNNDDKFSPVAQMRTVRTAMATAAQLNLQLVTLDFPKAFLLGKMDDAKPIFMYAPRGYADFKGEVYQILLPLYGLTVSSRRFYESLSEFMRELGFEHYAGGDPCLFRRPQRIPTKKEVEDNNVAGRKWNLEERPKGAEPRGPAHSLPEEAPAYHHPYPDFMDDEAYKTSPNVSFEPHHSEGLAPDATNGLPKGAYYELAICYVDDLLGLSHHTAALVEAFVRRFAATVSPPGSMYLGMNYQQNLQEGWIAIGFQTCLERAIERISALPPAEINLRSNVGVLLWVTLHGFGPYLAEVKGLTRRVNQNLVEDLKFSTALLYELHERRGERIFFRRRDSSATDFIPRTSRHDDIEDVSDMHGANNGVPVPGANGEILITAKDILAADEGLDVYFPEDFDHPDPENFATDTQFFITVWTDASYAADTTGRRSDMGHVIFLNNGPVDWDSIRMNGVADSSFAAEYCAASRGTKRELSLRNIVNFMGIQPPPAVQYCDSTSATQVAKNPHNLGAARNLAIRMHGIRYAIAHQGLQLKYSTTGDMVADLLSKRMPRKKLARLALVFYNNLRSDWHLNPDILRPWKDAEWFPDLDLPEPSPQVITVAAVSYAQTRSRIMEGSSDINDDDGAETEEEEDGHDESHTPWSESPYNPDFAPEVEDLVSDSDDTSELDEDDANTSEDEYDNVSEDDAHVSSSIPALDTSHMNMQARHAFSESDGYRNGLDVNIYDSYGLRMDCMDYHRMELQTMLFPHNVISDPPTRDQVRRKAHLEHREDRANLMRINSERLLGLPSTTRSMRTVIQAEKLAADEVRRRCREEYQRCAGLLGSTTNNTSATSQGIPPDLNHSAEDYQMGSIIPPLSTDTFLTVDPINGRSFADEDDFESNTNDIESEDLDSVTRLRGGAESDDDTDNSTTHRFHFVPRYTSVESPFIIPPRSAVIIDIILVQRARQQRRTETRISQLLNRPYQPQPGSSRIEGVVQRYSPYVDDILTMSNSPSLSQLRTLGRLMMESQTVYESIDISDAFVQVSLDTPPTIRRPTVSSSSGASETAALQEAIRGQTTHILSDSHITQTTRLLSDSTAAVHSATHDPFEPGLVSDGLRMRSSPETAPPIRPYDPCEWRGPDGSPDTHSVDSLLSDYAFYMGREEYDERVTTPPRGISYFDAPSSQDSDMEQSSSAPIDTEEASPFDEWTTPSGQSP